MAGPLAGNAQHHGPWRGGQGKPKDARQNGKAGVVHEHGGQEGAGQRNQAHRFRTPVDGFQGRDDTEEAVLHVVGNDGGQNTERRTPPRPTGG